MPLNFSPFSRSYFANMWLRNAVSFGENRLRFFAVSYGSDLRVRQLGSEMVKPVVMTTLLSCIFVVVVLGSYAKMLWVNARRVVASVHNYLPFRNLLTSKVFIRKSVRSDGDFAGKKNDPVPVVILSSRPQPAGSGFLDSSLKYVAWPWNWELFNSAFISLLVVTRSAKFAGGYVFATANNAVYKPSTLIGHGALPMVGKAQVYAMTLEVANSL